jgi:hypothetical protein
MRVLEQMIAGAHVQLQALIDLLGLLVGPAILNGSALYRADESTLA